MFRVNAYHEEDTELLSLTVFTLLIWNTKWIIPRTRCTCSRSHLFVDKCCEGTQDSLFFELDMGECRTLRFMTGVYPDDTLAASYFCMCVDSGLREIRECYNLLGCNTFAQSRVLSTCYNHFIPIVGVRKRGEY